MLSKNPELKCIHSYILTCTESIERKNLRMEEINRCAGLVHFGSGCSAFKPLEKIRTLPQRKRILVCTHFA